MYSGRMAHKFPETIAVYSETGGATKTTTALSLAMSGAIMGRRVTLVDLDPRGSSTKWLRLPKAPDGFDVADIMGNERPLGWAAQIAQDTGERWHPNLRFIGASRSLANREADREPGVELRLKQSLADIDSDLVVLDCPNRQGGPLTRSALVAATGIVFAAKPDGDGLDGVRGARRTYKVFAEQQEFQQLPVPEDLGIVIGAVNTTAVIPVIERNSIASLTKLGGVLTPYIPARSMVKECRASGEWYGNYPSGRKVADAYQEIAKQVFR